MILSMSWVANRFHDCTIFHLLVCCSLVQPNNNYLLNSKQIFTELMKYEINTSLIFLWHYNMPQESEVAVFWHYPIFDRLLQQSVIYYCTCLTVTAFCFRLSNSYSCNFQGCAILLPCKAIDVHVHK